MSTTTGSTDEQEKKKGKKAKNMAGNCGRQARGGERDRRIRGGGGVVATGGLALVSA